MDYCGSPYLCADKQTYSTGVDRAIPEIFSIRNSRMGVILVAPPHGYPQPALPAGPSQETHLLASSDVVDKEPEWKAG